MHICYIFRSIFPSFPWSAWKYLHLPCDDLQRLSWSVHWRTSLFNKYKFCLKINSYVWCDVCHYVSICLNRKKFWGVEFKNWFIFNTQIIVDTWHMYVIFKGILSLLFAWWNIACRRFETEIFCQDSRNLTLCNSEFHHFFRSIFKRLNNFHRRRLL